MLFRLVFLDDFCRFRIQQSMSQEISIYLKKLVKTESKSELTVSDMEGKSKKAKFQLHLPGRRRIAFYSRK